MGYVRASAAVRQIGRLYSEGCVSGLPDDQLLDRFAARRDESAFEAIVARHGPMVLATCRGVLRDSHAAEDAFQATFLVLARKAGSLWAGDSLAPWLHRVAYQVAVQAAEDARRRGRASTGQVPMPESATAPAEAPGADGELLAALHEELASLPDRHRLPVILCYLEGKTHAQAAAELRRGEATVRRRLAEARERLRYRLARRGLAPSAGLIAALLERKASAALASGWAEATAKAAARLALGKAATAGAASTAALVLSDRLIWSMALARLKAAAALVVGLGAIGWAASGLVFAGDGPEGGGSAPVSAVTASIEPESEPDRPPTGEAEEAGTVTYAGRVLDPEGRPFAGARVYVLSPNLDPEAPVERARTGADGGFRFEIDPEDRKAGEEPFRARLAARAEGYGLGLSEEPAEDRGADVTLRLVEDVPIEGRLVDLEGRPIVGATVRVKQVWTSPDDDLTPWIEASKAGEANVYDLMYKYLPRGILNEIPGYVNFGLLPPIATGPDGRFRVAGLGRERLAELRIEGPGMRLLDVEVMTRPGEPFSVPRDPRFPRFGSESFHASSPSLAASPSRPIVGIVRDKDTGEPIAGARVWSYNFGDENVGNRTDLQTTSDAEGRYRLDGMPRGQGNEIMVLSPEGGPYLPGKFRLEDSPGLGPVTFDIDLKRGVLIEGRVADMHSDEPVKSWITYYAAADNPHIDEAPGFRDITYGGVYSFKVDTDEKGRFRTGVLPGRGLLGAETQTRRYPYLKEEQNPARFDHVPDTRSFEAAFVELDIPEGIDRQQIDIPLDPGKSVSGVVLDPDGQPLAGARVYGLDNLGHWTYEPLEGPEFWVEALEPPRLKDPEKLLEVRSLKDLAERFRLNPARTLVFHHEGRQLAGWCDVWGDEEGPIRARLEPWGAVAGRLVDGEGNPLADATLAVHVADKPRIGGGWIEHRPERVRTDAEGRYRVDGLAPGLPYLLSAQPPAGMEADRRIEVGPTRPGEERDLGEIAIRFEEP